MKELEANMRKIEMPGLTWGASKLVPVGFGIKKLQVNLVVEDELVSIDDLQAQIESDEDHVQSTDVVCLPLETVACRLSNKLNMIGGHAKVIDHQGVVINRYVEPYKPCHVSKLGRIFMSSWLALGHGIFIDQNL